MQGREGNSNRMSFAQQNETANAIDPRVANSAAATPPSEGVVALCPSGSLFTSVAHASPASLPQEARESEMKLQAKKS
jgi:hypothetical protein